MTEADAAPLEVPPTAAAVASRSPLPGTPYHRLAVSAHWWSRLGELLLAGFLWFALSMAVYGVIHGFAPAGPTTDGGWGLLLIGTSLAVFVPAAMIAARVMGRLAGTMSSVVGRLRWRWLLTCVGIFFVAYVIAIGASIVIELVSPSTPTADDAEAWPGAAVFLPQLALILVVIPLQIAGEEYAFRGTLLQTLGAWFRSPWIAIVVTSVAFAAMHAPTEWVVWLALLATGFVTSWMTVKTGGLEAALAQHAVNNVIGFSADAATGGFGRWAKELNTDVPILHTLITIGLMLASAAVVTRVARRRNLATVVPDPPPA